MSDNPSGGRSLSDLDPDRRGRQLEEALHKVLAMGLHENVQWTSRHWGLGPPAPQVSLGLQLIYLEVLSMLLQMR